MRYQSSRAGTLKRWTVAVLVISISFAPFGQVFASGSTTIRQEINIIDSVVTTSSQEIVQLDTTQYNGTASSTAYYFEIVGKVTSGSATTTLRRFGTTTDDATITLTATTSSLYRVAFTPPANTQTQYFVNITGGTSPKVSAARIIVIQSGSPITSTETQIEIGNNETGKTNTTTSTGALNNPKYWYYNSSTWDGSPTFYAEVTYAKQADTVNASSATYATAGTFNWLAPTTISQNATITVEAWGGGGAGGGATSAGGSPSFGSGGGGGGYAILNSTSVTPGTTYSGIVAATTTGIAGNGPQGASSSFNNAVVVALGGAGGGGDNGSPGGGSGTSGEVGNTLYSGGSGSSWNSSSGAGGGGAGSTGNGGDGGGNLGGTGTSVGGGAGGNGIVCQGAGLPGNGAGGGGGGGCRSSGGSRSGGAGASGQVKISYFTISASSSVTLILQEDNGAFASWTDKATIVSGGFASSPTRVRSSSFTPTSGRHYRIVGKSNTASLSYNIYNAKIIVDQGSSPTKLEPQYLLLNTVATSTASNQSSTTTFSPNEWAGVSNTYLQQVDASSTASSTVSLKNLTGVTTLNTITGATSSVTSTISSMPTTTSTLDISITQNASTTYADRILVQVAPSVGPTTITLANGTTPSSTTIGPGQVSATSSVFTFTTDQGTSTITSVTVKNSTTTGVYQIQVTDSLGTTVFGSSTNPSASTTVITTSAMNVSSTGTTFATRILSLAAANPLAPMTYPNMSDPPGGTYVVTSTVSSWVDSKSLTAAGSNTTSSVITIDNASPADVTNASGTAGSSQVALSWTNPGDPDFATTTVMRAPALSTTTYAIGAGTAPNSIAFDGTNMWTANRNASSVTKISPSGVTSTYGIGAGTGPYGIAFDGTNMWTANFDGNSVTKITPSGATSTYGIGSGTNPHGIAFDGTNMWTANNGGSSVTKITPSGATTTYPIGASPIFIAFDGTNMWTANQNASSVTKISPSGATSTYGVGAGTGPLDIAFDGTNMWTANYYGGSVTKITPSGATSTYGIGAVGVQGIAFDGTNMWATDNFGNVTKITPSGATSTYKLGAGIAPYGIAFDGTNMWAANQIGNSVTKVGPLISRPVEGVNYAAGATIGSSTVACSVASGSSSCTDSGLTNGTTYNYEIFTEDSHQNYSLGTAPAGNPFTPSSTVVAGMSFVQSTSTNCGTATNCGKAFGSNVAAGDLIVVGLRLAPGASKPVVTDTQGNSYAQVASSTAGGADHALYVYIATTTSAGALTVSSTIIGSGISMRESIHEYSGMALTNIVDTSSSNSGFSGGSSLSAGNVTTTNANDLVFGWFTNDNQTSPQTINRTPPYTKREVASAGGNFCGNSDCIGSEDLFLTATTSTNAGAGLSGGSSNWGAIAVAFRGAQGSVATGTLTLKAEDGGQQINKFDIGSATNLTSTQLFNFKVSSTIENINISQIVFNLTNVTGFTANNITSTQLFVDTNGDGTLGAGETTVMSSGTTVMTGSGNGTITFTGTLTVTSSLNLILQANVTGIDYGDWFTITLPPSGFTSTGAVSGQPITAIGSTLSLSDFKPWRIGGATPSEAGASVQSNVIGGNTGSGDQGSDSGNNPPPPPNQGGGNPGGGGGASP